MAQVPTNTIASAGINPPSYGAGVPDIGGFLLVVLGVILLFGIALFIYQAFALMTIARKTNTPNGWLAFIPIANLYLLWRISRTPVWSLVLVLVAVFGTLFTYIGFAVLSVLSEFAALGVMLLFYALVFIFGLVSVAILSWWYWCVASARGYPGAVGLLASPLVTMIPYVNMLTWPIPLVTIGILAWRDPVSKQ